MSERFYVFTQSRPEAAARNTMNAKRRNSRYEPAERSANWLKVKIDRQQEFVIGGYRPTDQE